MKQNRKNRKLLYIREKNNRRNPNSFIQENFKVSEEASIDDDLIATYVEDLSTRTIKKGVSENS